MNETYYIPANYTDAGKVLGVFEIRNTIEAAVVTLPALAVLFKLLPFTLTTNLIIVLIIAVPLGGFALIGVNDDCLSRFIGAWLRWRKRRIILTYRGESTNCSKRRVTSL